MKNASSSFIFGGFFIYILQSKNMMQTVFINYVCSGKKLNKIFFEDKERKRTYSCKVFPLKSLLQNFQSLEYQNTEGQLTFYVSLILV